MFSPVWQQCQQCWQCVKFWAGPVRLTSLWGWIRLKRLILFHCHMDRQRDETVRGLEDTIYYTIYFVVQYSPPHTEHFSTLCLVLHTQKHASTQTLCWYTETHTLSLSSLRLGNRWAKLALVKRQGIFLVLQLPGCVTWCV